MSNFRLYWNYNTGSLTKADIYEESVAVSKWSSVTPVHLSYKLEYRVPILFSETASITSIDYFYISSGQYKTCYVYDNNTLVFAFEIDGLPFLPITVRADFKYTYQGKTGESYGSVLLGNESFNIVSNTAEPLSILNIALKSAGDSDTLIIKATTTNSEGVDVSVTVADIETSSAQYDINTWQNEGYYYDKLPANSSDYTLLYFSDGCRFNDYTVTLAFSYDGDLLGTLTIIY